VLRAVPSRMHACLAAGVAAFVALACASTALASDQLVIAPSSIAPLGWRSAGNSVSSARNQLRTGLSKDLAKVVKRSQTQAAAAATRGQRLSSDAFVFSSAGAAHRVLAAYKRVHHARRLPLGSDGSIARHRTGRIVRFSLAWRHGPRVALLQMQVPKRVKNGSALVLAMAKLADSALVTVLPTSAFGKIAGQIHPDGSVSPATALSAFALAYGGLPGVHVPSGDNSTPALDGTSVAAWVLQHISDYSREVQNEIWSKLGLVPPGQAHTASLGDPSFAPDAALTATANGWAAAYPGNLGSGALKYTIVAGNTTAFNGTHTNADAFPVDANGQYDINGPNCRIRFNASKNTPASAAFKSYVLAHETFHCFQFMIAGASWSNLPAWTLEATAEWAALTSTSPAWNSQFPNADSRWMIINIQHPETALFTRTYDAVDFWGHVQDVYGDLWTRLPAVLKANGSNAIFTAAGANTDKFLYSWASSLVDGAGGGPAWHLTAPVAVPAGQGVKPTDIKYSAAVPITNITVPSYATKHFIVHPDAAAPLVHIKINGHARFSSKHDYTTELKDGWFCVAGNAAACQCPNGQAGAVPAGYPTDGATELEVTGDPGQPSAGTVEYSPLDNFCKASYGVPKPAGDQRGVR
jgi:hypothetical protein